MSAVSLNAVDTGIPRRLSARPTDRFFDQGLVARMHDRVTVFLNGVELEEVTSWDVDNGMISRRARRPDGNLMLEASGTCTIEYLKGTVEVRWLPGMAP